MYELLIPHYTCPVLLTTNDSLTFLLPSPPPPPSPVVLESKVEQLEKELQETRQTHRQEVERLQKELQKGLATFLRPRASCQELAV